ncbi:MAG TPA: hypothetical protein VLH80_02545 [Nitrospiraceae bacterium]|jgi:hypothetical protein|nr:hypothetical protein [Nitrospiraceae bacterium]
MTPPYLPEEATHGIQSQTIGVISCSIVLCLGLLNAAQAGERKSIDPCAEWKDRQLNPVKCDKERHLGIHTIRGEALHIHGPRLLVKQTDDEEAIFHIDLSTQLNGHIGPESRIEANVNDVAGKKYALSISLIP